MCDFNTLRAVVEQMGKYVNTAHGSIMKERETATHPPSADNNDRTNTIVLETRDEQLESADETALPDTRKVMTIDCISSCKVWTERENADVTQFIRGA
jgi:hypothetical protein